MRFTFYLYILIISSITSCDYVEKERHILKEIEWVEISEGQFMFGDTLGMEHEKPAVKIRVESFFLSKTEVTNAMFTSFTVATGYITEAEKNGIGGAVFVKEWKIIKEANWRHPLGNNSSIDTLLNHPVVHVTYNDAVAYCSWMGGRLPSEIEWEFACKRLRKPTKMNIWSGDFPALNDGEDGYVYTAPVLAFSINDSQLEHIKGNVWEWCIDSYHYDIHDKLEMQQQSTHPFLGASFDPVKESVDDTLRVIKGGSFMCHKSYCAGYRPEARQSAFQSAAYFHVGFRIAKSKTIAD